MKLWKFATQPYKSFKFFEFLNYHKISLLSNSGLKIGNLTNFIKLFSLNEMMWTAGIQMKWVRDHRSESQFKQLRK